MGEARLGEPCRPGESREPNLTRPGTKPHAVAGKRSLSCISWPPRSAYRPAAGCIKPSISTAGESAPSGSAPRVAAKWLTSASATPGASSAPSSERAHLQQNSGYPRR